MRRNLTRTVGLAVPASTAWEYVVDWPRQSEWIPLTRVERVDAADGVGGHVRAWTGLGRVGFWDPMTITGWESSPDGGGACAVTHTGRVVRGEGLFAVVATGEHSCRFDWTERVDVPLGRVGDLGWRTIAAPLTGQMIDVGLRRLRHRVDQLGS